MSRLGAMLGVLHRGVMVPAGMGAAEPGLLTLPWDAPVFSSSDLVLPDPSPRAGWPQSFSRALATPWLVLARSGDGALVGADACHTLAGGQTCEVLPPR